MNLTLTLLLIQNLGPIEDTNWTVDIITRITNLYFMRGGDVFIFHYFPEEPEDFVMKEIMNHLYDRGDFLLSHLNGTEEVDPPQFVRPNGIILFIEFTKTSYQAMVTDFLMKILKNLHLNLRLIVILQYHKYVRDGVITFVFEKFWSINLRNIIIINSVINDLTPPSVKIFYWRQDFSFRKDSKIKSENIRKITLMRNDNQIKLIKSLRNKEMLSLVDVTDIRGHFLNVSVAVTPPYVWWKAMQSVNLTAKQRENLTTDKLDGIEVLIVKEFWKKFNLSGYFIIHPSEIIAISGLENESEDGYGVLEETALGMSDIAIGGNLATADLYSFFGATFPYFEDNMHWYAPGPKAIPVWMNNFLIFDNLMWSFTALSFLLMGVMIFVWFHYGVRQDTAVDFSSSLLTSWAVIVSQAVPWNIPDRMKLFFISAIIYGMHISYFYTSGLIIATHDVFYESPIMTVEEAKKADMILCLSGISYDFFRSQDMSFQMSGNFTLNVHLDYAECLDEVAEKRNTIALVPEKTTEYTIPLKYLDENHMEKIHQMPKRLISYPVSMYLTKASPYRQALNFVITGLLEGGFLEKWWKDIRFNGRIIVKDTRRVLTDSGYTSISLKNSVAVFFIYIVLLSVCFVSFLAEIIWFGMTSWKRKKKELNRRFTNFSNQKKEIDSSIASINYKK